MKKKIIILTAIIAAAVPSMAQYRGSNANEDYITVTDDNGQKEEIDVPPSLSLNVDSMLQLFQTRTYLSGDECNYRNYDPQTDTETFIERLRRLPTIMELPYNEAVRKFIDRYTKRARRQVSYMLGAANFYMPIFEEALETYSLPLELKYLPVIESALNPNALSRVGAAGLWQFMIKTGKQYGLTVNSIVDERRDPIKASYAAAHYLSDLYKVYHDWNLVIAAYNCGTSRVNKAIRRAGGETDYWKIYPYLPKETRGYVPSFIAANYIMNYYCDHNICPMETTLPERSDTVMVSQDVHLEQVASVLGIDINQLKELNPQYRHNIVNGYTSPAAIRLPQKYVGQFIDKESAILQYNADKYLTKRSEVNIGGQKRAAARTYHDGVVMRNNEPVNPDAPSTATAKHSPTPQPSSQSQAATVRVQSGQTLYNIATSHGLTVEQLKKLNNLKGNTISVGEELRIK